MLKRLSALVQHHEKSIKLAFTAFDKAADFLKSPSPVSFGRAVFGVLGSYVELNRPDDPFEKFKIERWRLLYEEPVASIFSCAIEGLPGEPIPARGGGSDRGYVCGDIGYVTGGSGALRAIYGAPGRSDAAKAALLRQLHELQPRAVTLASTTDDEGWPSGFSLVEEIPVRGDVSPMAAAKAAEMERYIRHGVSRAIMLHGPPGTGKSTMARALVQQLGLRTLRIRLADVRGRRADSYPQALEVLAPEAVIMDDFDRVNDDGTVLELLEKAHAASKLVILTCNKKNGFDPAVIRPGRVDEIIEVNELEASSVRALLGSRTHLFEAVKSWPAAFIVEAVQRSNVLGPGAEANVLGEMNERVSANFAKD